MLSTFRYTLTAQNKHAIAQNLVSALENSEPLSEEAGRFVANWILTGPNEKVKTFYDVWQHVLLNYRPTEFPVLFRSYSRFTSGKIVSFSGSIGAAYRFATDNHRTAAKGRLAICDTSQYKIILDSEDKGQFRHSFYPLGKLLKQERQNNNSVLSQSLLECYVGEDEYIMHFSKIATYFTKWTDD